MYINYVCVYGTSFYQHYLLKEALTITKQAMRTLLL